MGRVSLCYMLTALTIMFQVTVSFFFKFILFIFFFFFWLYWVLATAHGPSPAEASGGHSSPRCTDLSLRWPLPLRSIGSRRTAPSSCGAWAPEHRLSSCGPRAQLLRSMWDPPRPGLEHVSPALAGGLPTTVTPGKPPGNTFLGSSRFLKNMLISAFVAVCC